MVVERPVVGSIRLTVASPEFATHTAPAPTSMPDGETPTGIGAADLVRRSMRDTESSVEFVTQTLPNPAATAVGRWPTATVSARPVRARADDPHRVLADHQVGLGAAVSR